MRKYLLLIVCFFSFQFSFSQTDYEKKILPEFDSLKNILTKLTGAKRVDCLNAFARAAIDLSVGLWRVEADTARPYALQANKEAKRIGYKKGLGDSFVNLEEIDQMTFGWYLGVEKRFDVVVFGSAEQNAKNAISIGEELKDYQMLGKAYSVLNDLLSQTIFTEYQDQYMAANIDYAKKAIEYYSKTNNRNQLRESYYSYSGLVRANNDFDAAINSLEKAIQLSLEIGDKNRAAFYYANIMSINIGTGDFEKGFETNKKFAQLTETIPKDNKGYSKEYSNSLAIMAILYNTAGDYETAMDLLHKALSQSPPEDLFYHDFDLAVLGEAFRLAGKYDSALYYLAPFAKKPSGGNVLGQVYLVKLYLDLKEYDKALQVIESYKTLGKKWWEDPSSEGVALTLEAGAYLGKKEYKTALKYATTGLPILKAAKRKLMIIRNYELLSKIFHALGQNDSAYYYLSQYTVLKDSLLNRQFYFRLNSYKKQAEEERKTSQINLQEQKLKQQAIVKNGLIIGILLLFVLAVFIFRNLSLKRKTDKLQSQKDLEMQRLANDKKHAELQQQALELEMQALRAQINPHFIFNCLNAINRFIFTNETRAASDYLTRFSRLIRMVLLHSQQKLVPLEDELEMLRLYLDMERLRFKDNFDYHIMTTNAVETHPVFIPPLLLQPFCENAIWHGLMHKDGEGHLSIEINEESGILYCTITDNGVGREKAEAFNSKSAEKEKSLGLKITKERLSLLNQGTTGGTFYEIEDVLDEKNEVAGTKVQLKIRYKDTVEEYA